MQGSIVPTVEAVRRALEIEVDVLVAHELATNSRAGRLIWERVWGSEPSEPLKVQRQVPLLGTRTADIHASDGSGRAILIEDKARGGHFQPQQPEDYQTATVNDDRTRTCLIAPEAFISSNESGAKLFDASVSLEDLAEALSTVTAAIPSELIASYLHRRDALLHCALSRAYEGNPDEEVARFSDRYRELAEEITGGLVVLHSGTMKYQASRIVGFKPWTPKYTLNHKLHQRIIDFQVRGWTVHDLQRLFDGLPENEKMPEGWLVDTEYGAKLTKETGERPPVLRHRVGFAGPDLDFDAVRTTIKRALLAILDLREWFIRCGRDVLERPSPEVIDHHLTLAARHLRSRGCEDLATSIDAVITGLAGRSAVPQELETPPPPPPTD